jgi:Bacterial Ig-like domain (group 3)/PKD domain/SdrD B-like domain
MRSRSLRLRLNELEDRTVPDAGDIEWLREFASTAPGGAAGRAVDADGNVYVAGQAFSALPGQTLSGFVDAFVRKYDAAGNEVWTRQFGGAIGDGVIIGFQLIPLETATAVAVHGSAVYVAGWTHSALPGHANSGAADVFVRRYDADGNEVWTRQFGTSASDQAFSVAADATGVYVGGLTSGALPGQTFAGHTDAFVRKYDPSGGELWTYQFGAAGNFSETEQVNSIAADGSGVYVAGKIGLPNASGGIADAFVRKYDTAGNVIWIHQFGTTSQDQATGVTVDDSGIYVAGTTGGTLPGQIRAGGVDAFVRKLDANGTQVWTRQFGTTAEERINGVAADSSGVYLAGATAGALPGQITSFGFDAFVRKYDAAGEIVWTHQFGTRPPFDIAPLDEATGVAVDGSGVYVVGNAAGTLLGQLANSGPFVRKYDASGGQLWTRQFGPIATRDDLARAVDADGNVYVAGEIAGSIALGQTIAGHVDAFVRKYDAAGNELWTRQFGTSLRDAVNAVAVDASGVYVVGIVGLDNALPGQSTAGNTDAFVRKYDANGNLQWTSQFGSTLRDEATGVAVDSSGVYVVGNALGALPGQSSGGDQDAFIRKYDLGGTVLWTRQFSSNRRTGPIVPSPEDSATGVVVEGSDVYISGSTFGIFAGQSTLGGQDAFVRRYDSTGNPVWTRQFGTASNETATGIAAGSSGLYVSGSTTGTFAGETSAGGQDAFLRRMDTAGTALWTRQFGTSSSDQANGVAVGPTGVYVAGFVGGALPGKTSAGGQDAFVRRYDVEGATIWTGQFGTAATDSVAGVVVGTPGLYVAGSTTGTFPGQPTFTGDQDVFVAKIVDDVSNTAPSNVSLNLNATVAENGTATLSGSFTDPDADAHTVVIDWGPGEGTTTLNPAAGVTSFTATHTYSDDNPTGTASDVYSVSATVTDAAGGSAGGSTSVTVSNVAPGATITGPTSDGVYTVGTPVALTGSFTDAGPTDTHTAQWTIGDITIAGSLTQGSGSGTVSNSHTFTAAGVHTVRLTVTDDDGGTGTDLVTITVFGRPTSTSLSASATTPLFGVDGVAFTAAVAAVPPDSAAPTGAVTFYDGATVLAMVNLVEGSAPLTLEATALSVGSHTIRAIYRGDPSFAASESTVVINVLAPSTVQGIVYVDFNNDGQVNFGERPVADVSITLAGIDDRGHAVSRTVRTDSNGIYAFVNVRPSDAAGYAITESQPANLLDGRDTPGTVNGAPAGSAAINDTFSGLLLSRGGSLAENYNFGERPATTGGVAAGQTATIGFWQNDNGQELIQAVNGGASATQLGRWLARTFPNLYATLDGLTNAQVAAFYKTLFARTIADAPAGPPRVDAQVMATALAIYVTNQTLAGPTASAYGFHVSADGVGARTFNVGGNGAAFGVANNSDVSVMDLLLAVNARSDNGLLHDLNADGQIRSSEAAYRTMANVVFTGINEAGDI